MDELTEALAAEKDADVLRSALLLVARQHESMTAQRFYGDKRLCCKTCDDGRSTPKWPCATRAALLDALGVVGP